MYGTSCAAPPSIVAAESVYGDIARQIAGNQASVTSILHSPEQDPHLFEASPSAARALADARLVIANGAAYDPWMAKLLTATRAPNRDSIIVADLLHRAPGDNPHLWNDPQAAPLLATAVAKTLTRQDPPGAPGYARRLDAFVEALAPIQAQIAALKARFAGTQVAATEPVFGPMAAAIGLQTLRPQFGVSVMNDTEPRASDVAGMEDDLRSHRARALFVNAQHGGPLAERLEGLARQVGVPVIPVAETLPPNATYQSWITGELAQVRAALTAAPPANP